MLFPPLGHDWIILSSCYVKTDGDVTGWRELFSRLGVRDGLIIRKERVTLTAKELVRPICYFSYLQITQKCYYVSAEPKSPGSGGANGLYPVVWKASKFSGCMDTRGRTQDTALQINELVIKR